MSDQPKIDTHAEIKKLLAAIESTTCIDELQRIGTQLSELHELSVSTVLSESEILSIIRSAQQIVAKRIALAATKKAANSGKNEQ